MNPDRLSQLLHIFDESGNDPFIPYAIGLEYIKLRNLTAAEKYLYNLVKSHPAYLPTYYQLGQVYVEQDKVEMAKQTYITGIKCASEQHELKTKRELEKKLFL